MKKWLKMEKYLLNYVLVINALFSILQSQRHGVHGLSRGPPRIQRNEEKAIQVGRLGQEFRLNCPVESDPSPIVDWYKDGEDITAAWSRFAFKRTSRTLRIRPVHMDDSGIYECKGVNGFGSTMAKIRVIVVENTLTQEPKSPITVYDNNAGTRKQVQPLDFSSLLSTPPQLSRETLEQGIESINLSPGNTIRLRCDAKGIPTPKMTWVKDGKSIGEKLWKMSSWTLTLTKLEIDDSGTYECQGSNSMGKTNIQIRLHVAEIMEKRRPEFAKGFPANLTVLPGNEAVMECIVRSGFTTMPPHIKWLKRVPSDSDFEQSMRRHQGLRLLPVENTHVLVIQETQEDGIRINETERNGTFVSKLIIARADFGDEGNYLCLATNSQGYTFKEAKLSIVGGPEVLSSSTPLSFPLIVIALSILVGLLLIGLAYLLRKYQEKRKSIKKLPSPKKLTSVTSINTNFPHPREGYEQRELLVPTSTHSSSSSSSEQGSRGSHGDESHFHNHHHHHQSIPMDWQISRPCPFLHHPTLNVNLSKCPHRSSTFDTSYNESGQRSLTNPTLHFGHWT